MANKRTKTDTKSVGANCIRPNFEVITKRNNGITLIALIITIIVMLILVAVSVTVALNGGLFTTAKDAKTNTQTARDEELKLDDGQIEVDGKKYASYQDYLDKKEMLILPTGWSVAETKPEGWSEKVTAITDGTNTIPLPNGYKVSTTDGEDSIAEGLVVYDGTEENRNNEFVWIPVGANFDPTYISANYAEPKYLKSNYSNTSSPYDSQTTIDYLYGKKEDGTTSYYTIDINSADETTAIATNTTVTNGTTFDYGYHYNEMVTSVNKYDGFYIGRYETTIDSNGNIGSKYNTTVLTAGTLLKEGTNTTSNEPYYYRWWGLYEAQRNANVKGNKEYIQTNMIWGQQWEAMLTFLGSTQATSKISGTQSGVLKSGEATYDNGLKDVMNNIYDLRRNGWDWTAEPYSAFSRVKRGGLFNNSSSASNRYNGNPDLSYTSYSSRATLYIK